MIDRHRIPITILVCDDNDGDRALTRQTLEDAHVANTLRLVGSAQLLDYLYQRGAYAGETGNAPRPGLILLALNAPDMNGREALAAILADQALHDIPVVVMSSSALDARALGVNAVITKPVTLGGLIDATNVLGRYWLQFVEFPPRAE
jgi:two-component system response regulator